MTTEPRPKSTPPPIAFFTMFLVGLLSAAGFEAARDYVRFLDQRETARATSLDRQIDAVFVEPEFRITSSESDLYLVPRGDPAPPWGAVLKVTGLKQPLNLSWTRTGMLEVRYSHGCVQGFTNFWHSDDLVGGHRYVEVRLIAETDLPCGGETITPSPLKPTMQVNRPLNHTIAQTGALPRS